MAMPVLDNKAHEAFARAVASGESASDAFREHVSGTGKRESVWASASRLRVKVETRIRELRDALDDSDEWLMSKREAIAMLTRAVRTPLAEIDEHSDLAQEVVFVADKDGRVGTKIKAISKTDAIEKLAKMRRWYAEDQDSEQKTNALTSLVERIGGWKPPRRVVETVE